MWRRLILLVCLLPCLVVGCRRTIDSNAALAEANSTNLQRLANLYVTFQSRNEWRGPADEAKFRTFIAAYNPDKLRRIGVDPGQVDALFVSERDGQPFKIRYRVPGSSMGSSAPVVFEATGVDGRREVGFLNMTHEEFDQAPYDALWSGKTPTDAAVRKL